MQCSGETITVSQVSVKSAGMSSGARSKGNCIATMCLARLRREDVMVAAALLPEIPFLCFCPASGASGAEMTWNLRDPPSSISSRSGLDTQPQGAGSHGD